MRIRKRKPQLPLSSLFSSPLSSTTDLSTTTIATTTTTTPTTPHVVVQLQEDDDTDAYFNNPQPSDHHQINRRNSSSDHPSILGTKNFVQGEERGREMEKTSDARTGRSSSALGESNQDSNFALNQGVVKCIDDGEKEVPLKRRRSGSFKERIMNETEAKSMIHKDYNKNKPKTSSTKNMKKKSQRQNDTSEEDDEEGEDQKKDVKITQETKDGIIKSTIGGSSSNATSGAKKRGKGVTTLMEGSRCSRVNGRGWRCCQQTLVGYSLCEHHLGKGRLRSMNSVRNRNVKVHRDQKDKKVNGNGEDSAEDGIGDDEKQVILNAKKRKVKLGTNKARSITSLLVEANNEESVASEEDD